VRRLGGLPLEDFAHRTNTAPIGPNCGTRGFRRRSATSSPPRFSAPQPECVDGFEQDGVAVRRSLALTAEASDLLDEDLGRVEQGLNLVVTFAARFGSRAPSTVPPPPPPLSPDQR
jgi:hypothetical protein